jgi:hypothetical protein
MRTDRFRPLHQKMRQIDIFRKVIRHMLNSTVFPKPYTHTPTHTGISQRRAPQKMPEILEWPVDFYRILLPSIPGLLAVGTVPYGLLLIKHTPFP